MVFGTIFTLPHHAKRPGARKPLTAKQKALMYRTPDEAHMPLVKKPVRPKRNPVLNVRLGSDKYASWKAFLDNAYWSVELR